MLSYMSDAPLGKYCTFLAGGRAKRLAFAYDIPALIEGAQSGALVLGRGSNVLVGDAGYAGDVIINRTGERLFGEETCECDSGVLMTALAREYASVGRTGLEWAYGLPGTAGGAAVGNAGAFGGCMADIVLSVTVWHNGKEETLSAAECGFSYRHSDIRGTVLRLVLRAPRGNGEEIRETSTQNLSWRRANQPAGASAGSVFKKTADGTSAGLLLDRAGLKGLSCGGAVISEKHANFVLNKGGARAGDILQLITTAQAIVFDTFGVRLEREIKLLGDFF